MKRARLFAVLAAAAVVAGVPGIAQASWDPTGVGSGSTAAFVMPAGEAPTATATDHDVLVSWTEATFPNGAPVSGYVVTRYDVPGRTPATVGAGCDGVVTSLSCTESTVPSGTWRYTVTPIHETWTGSEGPASATVTVGTATLILSSSAAVTSLPATLEGDVAGFIDGESVVFRLDDPTSGTVLSGSITPDPVPSGGTSTVSVAIPSGTTRGPHTVYAIGSAGSTAGAGFTVLDATPPAISAAVIAKAQGGTPGYLTQGGTYYVYADVIDPDPASGLAGVTVDVSSVSAGQTAVAMTAGSYSVGGTTYGYRSAALTASTPLAAGAATFSVSATDTDGNTRSRDGFTVTVDDTSPSAVDVQATNVGGGTAGRVEAGDRLTFTFSEPVEPDPILGGWTGAATTVTVRLSNGPGGGERIQIWDAVNASQLPLGTVTLGRKDYVNGSVTIGSSTMVMNGSAITITFGAPSGNVRQAAGAGTMTWTPTTALYDWAANACLATAAIESGAADIDF